MSSGRPVTRSMTAAASRALTIKDCIESCLPDVSPPMLNSRVASSTRNLTRSEMAFRPGQQLRWIASFPKLLSIARAKLGADKLYQEVIKRELRTLDTHGAALFYVHPHRTGPNLPPVVYSEGDSTSYINVKLIWPAMYIILLLQKARKSDKTPFVSSAEGKRGTTTPDGQLFDQLNGFVKAVLEWKTSNALHKTAFKDFFPFLWKLRGSNLKVPARMVWPNNNDNDDDSDDDDSDNDDDNNDDDNDDDDEDDEDDEDDDDEGQDDVLSNDVLSKKELKMLFQVWKQCCQCESMHYTKVIFHRSGDRWNPAKRRPTRSWLLCCPPSIYRCSSTDILPDPISSSYRIRLCTRR